MLGCLGPYADGLLASLPLAIATSSSRLRLPGADQLGDEVIYTYFAHEEQRRRAETEQAVPTGGAVLERVATCLGPGADAALAPPFPPRNLPDRHPGAWGGDGDMTGDEAIDLYFTQATRRHRWVAHIESYGEQD